MASISVKDLYAWKLDESTDIAGAATAPTYGEAFRLAKAIQVTMTPQVAEATLYADGSIDEYDSSVTGYDISLNVNDISPEIEAVLLGKSTDTNGATATGNDDEAPAFAIAFRIQRSAGVGGGYEYRVLYKVRFKAFDESFQTKGESVEYQTPTITGKSLNRNYESKFNRKLVGTKKNTAITDQWFKTVYEKDGANYNTTLVPATAVTVSDTTLTLSVGDDHMLTAAPTPGNTTDSEVWTSSDDSIATVDTNGKVTAVAVGSVSITAMYGSASDVCNLTVQV